MPLMHFASPPVIWRSIQTDRQTSFAPPLPKTHGLNPANLMCGNGSDELLGLLCHVYLGAGDEAIITEHGFLVYKIRSWGRVPRR